MITPSSGRGRPTGYLQTPVRHRCAPPLASAAPPAGAVWLTPAAPVATVWRCPCGRLWIVTEDPAPTRSQVIADRRRWARARLLTRWRYRHAAQLMTSHDQQLPETS